MALEDEKVWRERLGAPIPNLLQTHPSSSRILFGAMALPEAYLFRQRDTEVVTHAQPPEGQPAEPPGYSPKTVATQGEL